MRPVVQTASLGRWIDPATAYVAICGDSDAAFWLDSGPNATTGVSYLGLASSVTTSFDGPVLDWLRSRLEDPAPTGDGFQLGYVGWLGYELRGETMGVPVARQSRYPDAAWLYVERCLAFDHASQTVHLLALDDVQGYRAEVEAALWAGSRQARPPAVEQPAVVEQPAMVELVETHWAYPDSDYLAMIRDCQESIRNGDAYQLCLTTEVSVDASPEPVAVYLELRRSSPTHHGAIIRTGGVSLLSASPEQFLTVRDGVMTTKPIKGTRPRGTSEASDWLLKEELESSDKERAENLMIVDLMRNDLMRISKVGSVGVTSLLAVESYAQVHQLVSTVRGELADGLGPIDAIEACFPAGSMTGAPKRSATLILDALEQRPRGIYAGAFGYVGLDGSIDLAMVIRSIVIDKNGSTIGTGGGITALSVPEEELAETKLKAAALLRVLGVR